MQATPNGIGVATLCLLLASVASAQQPGARQKLLPVAVALTPNAEAHTAQFAYVVESAVRRSLRHEFVDPVEKFDPDGVQVRADRRQKAKDSVAYGRRQYENLEEGLGIESFDRAIGAYEESALWETFPGLTEAKVMRILVRWAEDQTGMRREIQQLVSMDPRAEFPAELTSPELAIEVKRAKDQRRIAPKFALDVGSAPVAARVYVDGVYRGTTPTSVRGLPEGEHYLSLVAPGYQVVQKKVRVGAGATATETLKVADRARPFLTFIERIRKGFGDAEEVNAARVLARVTQADEVAVIGVRRDAGVLKIQMHRIVTKDGHAAAVHEFELRENDPDLVTKVDAAARTLLETDRPRGKNGEPLGLRSGLDLLISDLTAKVSEEKLRMGIGIGGGVLVATGLTLGLVANSRETDFRALRQRDPLVPQLASSGSSMAVAADVVTVLGLAATGTWAWMQFGRAAKAKGDLAPSPILEREEKKEEKKERKIEEWDPFASSSSPWPVAMSPLAAPGFVGVEGSF